MSGDLSALQLLVPEARVLLDAVRGLAGVGLLEPPHISLGYPWRTANEALEAVAEVRSAAHVVAPFDAVLLGPRHFAADSRGRQLVHVVPDDERPVRELADRLRADLREVHLSVGRLLPDADADAAEQALAPLLPLTVRIDTLELTVRIGGTWRPAARVALGDPAGPQRASP